MKDWKKIAAGNNLKIPDSELERIKAPLDALEEAFRPLVRTIPVDVEPAVMFGLPERGE